MFQIIQQYAKGKSHLPSLNLSCDIRFQRAFTACVYCMQPTKVIFLKTQPHAVNACVKRTQPHAVNACVKRSSQRSFKFRKYYFKIQNDMKE